MYAGGDTRAERVQVLTNSNLSVPSRDVSYSLLLRDHKGGSKMAVGYFEAFSKIWEHCLVEWKERGPTRALLTDFIEDFSNYGFITGNDVFLCLVLGVFFTILRYFLTAAAFKVSAYFFWNFRKHGFANDSVVYRYYSLRVCI